MFTATAGKTLLTTTTGALPRPSWYTANLRGMPLSRGFSRADYREQHFDCLACNVAAQHRAGIDIFVDGDARLDDDVAGRSWVSYATERIAGIGSPRVEVPPAHFMADKGPGDLMWEVIETRMTPPVEGKIGDTALELDRAYKEKKVALGVISHRTLQVERPEEVAALIRLALEHVEPERLILSSDCGFGRQSMSRMHAYYKMVALVRGANIVRRELGLPEAYVPGADPRLSMVPVGTG
jgi:methionine synthase II (cobalamin-independent)